MDTRRNNEREVNQFGLPFNMWGEAVYIVSMDQIEHHIENKEKRFLSCREIRVRVKLF